MPSRQRINDVIRGDERHIVDAREEEAMAKAKVARLMKIQRELVMTTADDDPL